MHRGGMVLEDEGSEVVCRKGFADQKALNLVAIPRPQKLDLTFGFDTFGDDRQTQGVAKADYGLDDFFVACVTSDTAYKGSVHLEPAHREMPQIRQGGLSGAEIVHGDTDTSVGQSADILRDLMGAFHGNCFGDFQVNIFNVET